MWAATPSGGEPEQEGERSFGQMLDTVRPVAESFVGRFRGLANAPDRKGVDSSERLGRRRWVIERTMSWLTGYRRLNHRYERHSATTWHSSGAPQPYAATRDASASPHRTPPKDDSLNALFDEQDRYRCQALQWRSPCGQHALHGTLARLHSAAHALAGQWTQLRDHGSST